LRATTLNTSTYQVGPRQQTSSSMDGPMATAITTVNYQGECPVGCHCSTVNVVGGGPLRTAPAGQWRYEPYGRRNERVACTVCRNYGHSESTCWEKNPHLKLR